MTTVPGPTITEHLTVSKAHVLETSQGFRQDWGTEKYRPTATKKSGYNSCLNSWVQIAGVPKRLRCFWSTDSLRVTQTSCGYVTQASRSTDHLAFTLQSFLPSCSTVEGSEAPQFILPRISRVQSGQTILVTPVLSNSEKIWAAKNLVWTGMEGKTAWRVRELEILNVSLGSQTTAVCGCPDMCPFCKESNLWCTHLQCARLWSFS